MIAAGKKNRLKMKYPMKLWPLRPATRAGQNAITTQTKAHKIHHKTGMTYPPRVPCGTLLHAAERQLRHRGPLESDQPMHFLVPGPVAVRAPGTVTSP